MSSPLTWVFVLLTSAVLLLALAALWQSLRAAFGVVKVEQSAGAVASEERAALLDEKASLLQSIRDLELDRDSGKISEPDFERLNGQLRSRARLVLQMLDEDVRPYRPQAEALVAEAMQAEGLTSPTSPAMDPVADEEPAAADAATTPDGGVSCADCDANNDTDAVF
ncbi:MAG: hypothetical protein ACOCXM_11210, partial [Myxococcota bacterium]